MQTQLYRHYSSSGDLLYVGISLSAVARLSQHMRDARWQEDIARVEIENHPTRHAALRAEAEAIVRERPIFNIQGTQRKRPKKPKAFNRIEYDEEGLPMLHYGPEGWGGLIFTIDGSYERAPRFEGCPAMPLNSLILGDLLDLATDWFARWRLSAEAQPVTKRHCAEY